MRFLVVGLGSMGKRRVRNLLQLGITDITGFDPRADRRAEAEEKYAIKTEGDWATAEQLPVDAWIISTPPETHLTYGFKALDRGCHFFCEANVTDPRGHEMVERLKVGKLVGAPSSTMRYFDGPMKMKELLDGGAIGKPLSFTYHSGQYLPDWHPWESYKDFYVSRRDTGACREIVPFELSWMVDMLGPVDTLMAMRDKVTDLDCDIDDVYHLLLRFKSGMLGHLLVDVVSRPAFRLFRINGSEGSLDWNHATNSVRLWTPSGRANDYNETVFNFDMVRQEAGYIHSDQPYEREIADFLAAIKSERPWPFSFEKDEAVLELLVRAEKSSDQGVRA